MQRTKAIVSEFGDSPEDAGAQLLERLRALPGGQQLLDLAVVRDDMQLIGGATRDLLLGRQPRELDVVVAGAAPSIAAALAAGLGVSSQEGAEDGSAVTVHERFGTALVCWPSGRIDIAERRTESYATPGALPDVGPGSVEQDLRRRDFTVNAIALALGGADRGRLNAVAGALEDLDAGRLRVLHPRSFLEDPTRLLRLARYRVRLAFEPDPETAALAAQAIADGALGSVSGARIGAELRLALREPDPVVTLQAFEQLGVLGQLHPELRLDVSLAHRALALLPADGRADLLVLACLLNALATPEDGADAARALLDDLQFAAGDRDRVADAASLAPSLAQRLQDAQTPSQLHQAVGSATPEAVALAGALATEQVAGAARRWLDELRHVRLRITGEDLLAAGVEPGPEIGRRLRLALRRKLDGELADTREAELDAAIEDM